MRLLLLRDIELDIDNARRSLKAGKVITMRGPQALILVGNGSAKFWEGEMPADEPEPTPVVDEQPAPKRKRSKK